MRALFIACLCIGFSLSLSGCGLKRDLKLPKDNTQPAPQASGTVVTAPANVFPESVARQPKPDSGATGNSAAGR